MPVETVVVALVLTLPTLAACLSSSSSGFSSSSSLTGFSGETIVIIVGAAVVVVHLHADRKDDPDADDDGRCLRNFLVLAVVRSLVFGPSIRL